MPQKTKEKVVSQAEYGQLCVSACKHPGRARSNETIEDAYWRSICREVYRYLNVPFYFHPIEGAPRGKVYRENLRTLMYWRQNESFEPLAIARAHISQAIERRVAHSKRTGI